VWNPTAYKVFLAMLTGLRHPEACFLSGIKAFFIEHRGYNELRYTVEGGHDAVVWTSLGTLPRWVPGPTTRWAPGTTRLVPHGT
jgi:hypothetical protein